jgi:hypothetical protein
MSHNTGTGDINLAGKRLLTAILTMVVLLLCASFLGFFGDDRRVTSEHWQATATAEALLTEMHEEEARGAIENFELKRYSLEAHKDPSIQSQVVTGPYLNLGWGEEVYDEPFWLVVTSADVEGIQVLEYNPERLKAVAFVDRTLDKTTTDEVVLESSLPAGRCGVYVFLREDNTWKLAGFFVLMGTPQEIERDWNYAPDWLKETIGELPDWKICRDWMSGTH